jgi:hypothetical protein
VSAQGSDGTSIDEAFLAIDDRLPRSSRAKPRVRRIEKAIDRLRAAYGAASSWLKGEE